ADPKVKPRCCRRRCIQQAASFDRLYERCDTGSLSGGVMAANIQAGFIALNRFGLGSRRDGDLAAAASDPRGLLKAELARPGIALLEGPDLPRTALALKMFFADQEQKRLERLAAE